MTLIMMLTLMASMMMVEAMMMITPMVLLVPAGFQSWRPIGIKMQLSIFLKM